MDEKALLQAIREVVKEEVSQQVQPINQRLDKIENKLEAIEEDVKVTRSSVNLLLEWAEDASVQVNVPLFKKAK